MKIYSTKNIIKKSFALPLGWISEDLGGIRVDENLTEYAISELDEKFNIQEVLGEGMWGIAFKIDNNKVLKITTDIEEVKASLLIQGTYGPFPKIYEIGGIDESGDIYIIDSVEQNYILYYVVKEIVKPLDGYTLKLIKIWDWHRDEGLEEQRKLNKDNPEKLNIIQKVEDYVYDISNYTLTDCFNENNIGFDEHGNIVCFDPRT